MANLLESLQEHMPPLLISEAAEKLGEPENSVLKSMGGIAATILAGLLEKSNDPQAMQHIHGQLAHFPLGILDKPGDLLSAGNLAHGDPKDASGQLLGYLFGPKVPAITNAVAAFSGARPENVSFLLGVAGPIVMSLLGKRIQSGSLNISGLVNLLQNDREQILGTVPSGLGVILGLHAPEPPHEQEPPAATGTQWAVPLAILLAIGVCVLVFLRQCQS